MLPKEAEVGQAGPRAEYALMEGFGIHEVIVIKNLGPEINVEDLASVEGDGANITVVGASVPSLQDARLIAASGVKTNVWYVVGVGVSGMLQNAIVVGTHQAPDPLEIHLRAEGKVRLS